MESGRGLTYREFHALAKSKGLEVGDDPRPHFNWRWKRLLDALKRRPEVRVEKSPGLPVRLCFINSSLPLASQSIVPLIEEAKEEKPEEEGTREEGRGWREERFPIPPSHLLTEQVLLILKALERDKKELGRLLREVVMKIGYLQKALNEPWVVEERIDKFGRSIRISVPPEFRERTPNVLHTCGADCAYLSAIDRWHCPRCRTFFSPLVPPLSMHRFPLILSEISTAIGAVLNLIIHLEEAREAPIGAQATPQQAQAKVEEKQEKISIAWGLITRWYRPSTPPAKVLGEYEVESVIANLKQVLPILNRILTWFDKTVKRHKLFPALDYWKDHRDLVNEISKVANYIIAGVAATVLFLQQQKDKVNYQLARSVMQATIRSETATFLPRIPPLSPEVIGLRPAEPTEEGG